MTDSNKGTGGDGLLPPVTTFNINYEIQEGPRRGQHYQGVFEFKVPNAGKRVDIARTKAMYLPNGVGPDLQGALLVEMFSYLQHTLTRTPPWWKPDTFFDTGVVAEVYGKATDYENRFLGAEPQHREDEESPSEEGQDESGTGPDGEGSVDGDVPPSRKRREVLTAHDS